MTSTAFPLRSTCPPRRPRLRVLPGLDRRPTYLRRRLVAAVLAVALLVTIFLLASTALARIAGGVPSSAAGGPSEVAAAGPPATVVVQPGDTLWSIAAAVAPEVDVRITVDRLMALNGSSPIVVGQQLELP